MAAAGNSCSLAFPATTGPNYRWRSSWSYFPFPPLFGFFVLFFFAIYVSFLWMRISHRTFLDFWLAHRMLLLPSTQYQRS